MGLLGSGVLLSEERPAQAQRPIVWARELGALNAAIVIYELVGYVHGMLGYPVHG